MTNGAPNATTVLDPSAGRLVIINTYMVDPARADELVEFLTQSTLSTLRRVPGFVSANLHLAIDRTQVVNYAQWESSEALAAARGHAQVVALMQEALRIATSFSPILYALRTSIAAER